MLGSLACETGGCANGPFSVSTSVLTAQFVTGGVGFIQTVRRGDFSLDYHVEYWLFTILSFFRWLIHISNRELHFC